MREEIQNLGDLSFLERTQVDWIYQIILDDKTAAIAQQEAKERNSRGDAKVGSWEVLNSQQKQSTMENLIERKEKEREGKRRKEKEREGKRRKEKEK